MLQLFALLLSNITILRDLIYWIFLSAANLNFLCLFSFFYFLLMEIYNWKNFPEVKSRRRKKQSGDKIFFFPCNWISFYLPWFPFSDIIFLLSFAFFFLSRMKWLFLKGFQFENLIVYAIYFDGTTTIITERNGKCAWRFLIMVLGMWNLSIAPKGVIIILLYGLMLWFWRIDWWNH